MARVSLISPPYHDVYRKINYKNFGVLQPPLGLAYIAGYLKKKGHDVRLIDGSFSEDLFSDIKKHVQVFNPEHIGLTATTPKITGALDVAGFIKKLAPSTKTVLGGYHASALPEECVDDPNIDIVVVGEGEETFSEILEKKALEDVKGICFKEGGSVKTTMPRPLIEDLDSLPFPLWEDLPVNSYYYYPEKAVGVISGRGCPYECSFCASSVINKRLYRVRSPDNFVDEVEWLHKKFGVKHLFFVDETFTIELKRTGEICSEMMKRKIAVEWTCDTRVDHLTWDILKTMHASGCRGLRIGVESADDLVLKATGKDITLKQVENAVSWAKKLGIKVTTYFLLGLPFETPETLRKDLAFAKKLNTDIAQFSMLAPLPGTRIWDTVKQGKILRCTAKSWKDHVRYDNAIVESDSLSSAELLYWHRKMVRVYYIRFRYIVLKLYSIRSFRELQELFRAGLAVLKMIGGKR